MSRSQQQLTNPASYVYEWGGGNGTVTYFDKERGEKGENVTVKLPIEMLVLDQLHGVAGWSDQHNSGIWSTETRSTKDDFTVRAGKHILYVGPYKVNGISQVAGFGGKYCKIVYFATMNSDGTRSGYILNRFKLTGAALNAWIDICNDHKVENGKVTLTGSTEAKKGATTYQVPTFEYTSATPEEDAAAIALDKDLQVYLNQYLTAKDETDEIVNGHEDVTDSYNTDGGKASAAQVIEFQRLKDEKNAGSSKRTTTFQTQSTDKPMNWPDEDDEAIGKYQEFNKDDLNDLFGE